MSDFRFNHYVPQAYQYAFIPSGAKERKFYYHDLRPERVVTANGRSYMRADILRWGPPTCFAERDLYTTQIGSLLSTALERGFIGTADRLGPSAVEYFASYRHPSVNHEAFGAFIRYMSLQKLRTPKGLIQLGEMTRSQHKNETLARMRQLYMIFCAIWSEGVWCILDAAESPTKFILSDHPVTVYNRACLPESQYCRNHRDPDIRLNGTHTLIPLCVDKLLVITNLSWIRNPYSDPLALRPNPNLFRPTIFKYTDIQTGRMLSEIEVCEINYVIKQRAFRYIAAAEKEWLYPERAIPTEHWDKLGNGYLFMPDPRGMSMGGEVMMKFSDGRTDSYDAYGRKPWEPNFGGTADEKDTEWVAHLAYQGEYARVFGPKRRGLSYDWGKLGSDTDSPDFHAYHLRLEAKYKYVLRQMQKGRRT